MSVSNPAGQDRWLTPPQLASQYGVGPEAIIALIKSGELDAIDISPTTSQRPRYRISPQARQSFERARATAAGIPTQKRRRKKRSAEVHEYF